MEYTIVVLAIVALFCKVEAQVCVNPGVPACSPIVTTPQVLGTPAVVTTTVVDNTVSNALANALQLIIVADLIETRNGAQYIASLLNPACNCVQPIPEIVTPLTPCGTPVEIISPCAAPVTTPVEVISPCTPYIQPYPYLCGCSEVVDPSVSYVPNYNCPCVPAPVPVPEVVNTSSYINYCYNPCGVPEIISPCGQYNGGVLQVSSCTPCNGPYPGNFPGCVTPCGVPEVIQPCPTYNGGVPQVIYPPGCAGIPEYIPFNPYGYCYPIFTPCVTPPPDNTTVPPANSTDVPPANSTDVPPANSTDVPPANSTDVPPDNSTTTTPPTPPTQVCNTSCLCGIPTCAPNFCSPAGSVVPLAAEVIFPASIPVQLNCNFGYTPSIGPCINFDVAPCGCVAS